MPSLSSNSHKSSRHVHSLCIAIGLLLFSAGMCLAAAGATSQNHTGEPASLSKEDPPGSVGDQFCKSIASDAAEARVSWQNTLLEETRRQLSAKIVELKAEREAYLSQLDRYKSFLSSIESNVIEMYTKMRPEAAAQQLSLLDNNTAVAIMLRLKPRSASAILNEMEAARASELASLFSKAIDPAKGKCQ